MVEKNRRKIDRLILEADRYAIRQGWKSGENPPSFIDGFAARFLKNMPLSNRYGLVAILISYPGLIPIIAFGGTNPLPQNLAIASFGLVSMSMPFFLQAVRAERADQQP